MRAAAILASCVTCAIVLVGATVDARAQGGPMPYAPMGGPPRGALVGPGRGPFGGGPRGPFVGQRGPFFGPMHGPFIGPFRRPFFGPPRGEFGGALPRGVIVEVPGGRNPAAPPGRICFNPIETREKIATFGLSEPFRALDLGRQQGEALRARLCRWGPEQFIYDVAVLRDDGRIVHVYMNAHNGQSVGGPGDPGHR